MSVFDSVIASRPVNRTAARVTSQSGSVSDELSELEGLKCRARGLQAQLEVLPKKSKERARLSKEFGYVSQKLGEIKPETKRQSKLANRGLAEYIVDVLQMETTKPEFARFVRLARELRSKDQGEL